MIAAAPLEEPAAPLEEPASTAKSSGVGTEPPSSARSKSSVRSAPDAVAPESDRLDAAPHDTPASSEWRQLFTPQPLNEQSASRDSVPAQRTSSIQIGPVPAPNAARRRASPPV